MARAASTVSRVPDHRLPLPPKPPPTNGATTVTLLAGTSNRSARCLRNQSTFWEPSHTVTRSPSHAAVVVCGSMALWFWMGVVKRRSTRWGAAASAASASPLDPATVGIPSDCLTGSAWASSRWNSMRAGCWA